MAEVVYVLGAGINQGVKDFDGLGPPMSSNFFRQALKHPRIGHEYYKEKIGCVFEYILQYWKLSIKDLESVEFDIESCFTLLQLQLEEAYLKEDHDVSVHLSEVNYRLTAMLAEFLQGMQDFTHSSDSFMAFGKIIHHEKPAVLTFNYDTILESAIESASGVNTNVPASYHGRPPDRGDIPDEELPYSHMNWNRPLAYGVEFDEVQLHRAGLLSFVPRERFYAHPSNKLYSPPFLKLHGSINWFVYTGIKRHPFVDDAIVEKKKGKSLLFSPTWFSNEQPDLDGIIIAPIIVTPVVNKQLLQFPFIPEIWQKAKEQLSTCRRLVVGGYSFPPTDFHTRRLFIEAFSDHTPDEIAIINPDTRIVQLVKDLCHFKKPVLACRDLDEFMSLYEAGE